ncbi:GNAT family N-acetyltransferase [Nibrella viscosa]|uniref:GNAT family N-acetyltransferase n=1 Tax=Nibrella viscosa TaxID=1084524 RepID=A0ABP8JVS7_9BACT
MTIRSYTDADRDAVLALLRLNTPAYFAESEEADLVDYLHHHSQHYFVVELDNEIVGCGGFNLFDEEKLARISWDIIHPYHQGKGLGRQLTQYRIDRIKEYPHIHTIVVRTSQLVYTFYEKFGFVLRKIVNNYWAEGYDLYYMEYPAWNTQKAETAAP